jgi:hypothetical protein
MAVKVQLQVRATLRQGRNLTVPTEHGVEHFEEKISLPFQGIESRFVCYLVLASLPNNINSAVADVHA